MSRKKSTLIFLFYFMPKIFFSPLRKQTSYRSIPLPFPPPLLTKQILSRQWFSSCDISQANRRYPSNFSGFDTVIIKSRIFSRLAKPSNPFLLRHWDSLTGVNVYTKFLRQLNDLKKKVKFKIIDCVRGQKVNSNAPFAAPQSGLFFFFYSSLKTRSAFEKSFVRL